MNVNIEKILPVTEVRDSLNKIIDEVESSDELYVVTKNGKPSAIIVGVHHLEKLTGIKHDQLMPESDFPSGGSGASAQPATTSTDDMAATATASATPAASPADQSDTDLTPAATPIAQSITPTPANSFSTPPVETPVQPVSDSAVEDLFSDEASAPSVPDQANEPAPLSQSGAGTPAPSANNALPDNQPAGGTTMDNNISSVLPPLDTPPTMPANVPSDSQAVNTAPIAGSQANPITSMPNQTPPAGQNQPQI